MNCSRCGAAIGVGAKFCPSCGVPVPAAAVARFCANCGASMAPGAGFCGSCGARQPDAVGAQAYQSGQPAQPMAPQFQQQRNGRGSLWMMLAAIPILGLLFRGGRRDYDDGWGAGSGFPSYGASSYSGVGYWADRRGGATWGDPGSSAFSGAESSGSSTSESSSGGSDGGGWSSDSDGGGSSSD